MTTQTSLTATDLLRQRHKEITSLFEQTLHAEGERRSELFDCLRATLAVHETVEEMLVHPIARAFSDAADDVVLARLEEEESAKKMLVDLEKLTTEGDGWAAAFQSFKSAVLRHAEAEERELFPLIDANCDQKQLEGLATALKAAEKLAPTHPHPHAGENPIALFATGPFAAMVDKARDAIKAATQRN